MKYRITSRTSTDHIDEIRKKFKEDDYMNEGESNV